MSDKNNETTHNLTKEEIDQAFFIPKVNIPSDGKVQLSGRGKRKVARFIFDGYNNEHYCDDGWYYHVDNVHEAIKKSIDNESIDEIKADLVAYFGLEI